MQTITTIDQINSDQFYKGYLYSEIWNSVAQTIIKNIQNKLSKKLWDNFQSVEHLHKTWRYLTQEKGDIIIKTFKDLIIQSKEIEHNNFHKFSDHNFHKSHLRESFDNHKRYIVLIPHEDNLYYNLISPRLTPHISLGTYHGPLADGQLLNIFRSIKDAIFQQFNENIFHIQPDIEDIKIKFKEIW